MEKLVTLGFGRAVDAIKDCDFVMYRHGVWNAYTKTDAETVRHAICNSGYGADVFKKDGMVYVSIPTDSDMW